MLKLCCFVILAIGSTTAFLTEDRQVSGFNTVESSGPFIVSVELTGKEGLRIDANLDDKNITDLIEAVVQDQTLRIHFLWPYNVDDGRFAGLIQIYVSAKSISSVVLNGAGSITVLSKLENVPSISLVNSGSGNVTAGVVTNALSAVLSGTGAIFVSGSARNANVVLSGAGFVSGDALQVEDLSATIYGAGYVVINVSGTMSVVMMGSGKISYRGNPQINNMNMGTGSLEKLP